MKLCAALVLTAAALAAASPTLNELQPRGAQKGRPFTLTVVGRDLGEGATLVSNLPATFTSLGVDKPGMESRRASFLVEPTGDWNVGVYTVRVKTPSGLSNILLFSIGAFQELTEEESREGSLPNQNDSIEKAQAIPSSPLTLNGTLMGPERDVYRVQVKAGERRVFEVDARRAGSAIDPVIIVYDGAGKMIARSEDDPLLQLDARLDMTFPKEGYYYVEVHDARFSKQAQNYYRLKTGNYNYATELFPLGGQRGQQVEVAVAKTSVKVDLKQTKTPEVFVNLPDSPALPLPFAVGDYPEVREPVTGPLTLPITVNGKLSAPAEIDKYQLDVKPGEEFIFELQARELGTSKLTGLITVYDEKGTRLASGGDGPLPVDVAAVQASSRTLGDPYLQFKVPDGVNQITVTVEDLARRGGPYYGYRFSAYRAPFDFRATITSPYVNIPQGGTTIVNFSIERRGYTGPLSIEAVHLPKGIEIAGGNIPGEIADPSNRSNARRGFVSLSAPADSAFSEGELAFKVIGTGEDGKPIEREATGLAYAIGVAGATTQGVVDRQRPLTGEWLGYQLPAMKGDAPTATLELKLESSDKKESGFEYRYRWHYHVRNTMQKVPATVSVDLPNLIDLRVIEMAVDKEDPKSGTFLVTTTRNTLPALYNIGINGRMMVDGAQEDIYSPLQTLTVPVHDSEEKTVNATTAARP
ncbi:MAG: hypothetical protein ABI972_24845 [Acidobacteriota bacterium]